EQRRRAQDDITRWIGTGLRTLSVAGTFPLEDTAGAHEMVEAGGKVGTVDVEVGCAPIPSPSGEGTASHGRPVAVLELLAGAAGTGRVAARGGPVVGQQRDRQGLALFGREAFRKG